MVPVTVSGLPYGVEVTEVGPANITVSVDRLTEKEMPVTVTSIGNVSNDLSVFSLKPSTSNVTVMGPESIVKTIDRVTATVELGQVGQDTTQHQPLTAYTKEGAKVTDITISETGVDVEILLGEKKTAQVVLTVQGKPAEGYAVTAISSEPDTVEIITRDSTVSNVSAIVNLSGQETADVSLAATYNIDENMITVINAPTIRAVLKITPIQ